MKRIWFKIGSINLVLGLLMIGASLAGLGVGADLASEAISLANDGINVFKVALLAGISLSMSSIFCFANTRKHKK